MISFDISYVIYHIKLYHIIVKIKLVLNPLICE